MSSRIRFAVARNVFEAFPDLRYVAPLPVDECAPVDYARSLLASRRPVDAIAFLAYLLPRREAVWWARQCVGAILGPGADDAALHAAEAWVRTPEEENRRTALAAGAAGEQNLATTWLAHAAGWSGGSMCPPEAKPMAPPASACAKAANAAIVLAACSGDPLAIGLWIVACGEAGIRFAEGGEARVEAPRLEPPPVGRALR
jgi:Family of unknown function (DUF6931)